MKRIIRFLAVAAAFCLEGCEVHEIWGDGRADLEHVYIFLLDQPDNQVDYLSYEIAQNGDARWRYGSSATTGIWQPSDEQWVASVPFRFSSKQIRTYDVMSFIWMESDLTAGTDYTVTREDNTIITPNADGSYSLVWPQAKKGIQNIKIKRTQGSPDGTIKVQTFNPTNGIPIISNITSLVNNKTAEYEVRCTTLDVNKVTITFN
ncbi:MAG: hypothetical protein LBC19_15210 [Tannerella sp.]|jgi:hypothetical protein|nr:hypothetical protein [Tannerella sp.]